MIGSLHDLARRYGVLSEAEFLRQVSVPHLLFSRASPTRTTTTSLGVLTRELSPAELQQALAAVCAWPVQKSQANAFGLMITVGRAQNNDIVIDHPRVSKFHVYLRRAGDAWTLSDAGSTNGTAVDGVQVPARQSVPIRSGSTIVLGGAATLEFLEPRDLHATLRSVA